MRNSLNIPRTRLINQTQKPDRTQKPDPMKISLNRFEPDINTECILFYEIFGLRLLSELNSNLNGYPTEPKTFKISKENLYQT